VTAHVEFLGPPGAGKTTLYRTLVERNGGLFGGVDHSYTYVSRRYGDRVPSTVHGFPILEGISKYLWRGRLRWRYVSEFLSRNPDAAEGVSSLLRHAERDKQRLIDLVLKSFASYQFAVRHSQSDEVPCLDEGFCERARSAMQRSTKGGRSVPTAYLSAVPLPEAVVRISAPPKDCLRRQDRRGRVTTRDEDEIERMRGYCDRIEGWLKEEGVLLITVNNPDGSEIDPEKVEDRLLESGRGLTHVATDHLS
jgi:thymidylate kinase